MSLQFIHRACLVALASGLLLASPLQAADVSASASTSASAAASNASASDSAPAANTLRIHYKRNNGDQADWGVYAWEGPEVPSKKWIADRFMFTGKDSYGGYTDIPIAKGKIEIRFLVTNAQGHKNCNTDQNHPLKANIATVGQEMWVLQASCEIRNSAP